MTLLSFILILILLIISILICLCISKSFLHPINLSCLIWYIIMFFSIIYFNKFEWNYDGVIWIILYHIFMGLGAFIINNKKSKKLEDSCDYNLKDNFNWKIVKIIIFIGFISFIIQLSVAGFSLASFTDFDSFINMNSVVAYNRYYGTQQTNFISQFLLIFVYLSSIVGGYSFNFSTEKKKRLLSTIGSFTPIIGIMLFSNTKAGFIACTILWITGWCISYLLINKTFPKIKFKNIIISLICIFSFCLIMYSVMLIRTGDFSLRMQKIIFNKFGIYSFAQTLNFDYWFSNYRDSINLDLGINTYMASFKTIGMANRTQGVYNVLLNGYGNVFTSFRGIIMDFGILGGLIYGFFRGIVIQICVNGIINNKKKKYLFLTILSSNYFFNIYGIIISPWIYTSYTLTIISFLLFLIFVHKIIKIRKK